MQYEIFATAQIAFNFKTLTAISSKQNQELYRRISTRISEVTITQHKKRKEEIYEKCNIKWGSEDKKHFTWKTIGMRQRCHFAIAWEAIGKKLAERQFEKLFK